MKIIGHRGARSLAPENTLVSIERALKYHVDEIEVDVRVTKDDVAILSHEAQLDAGGAPLSIREHTLKQLRKHSPDLASLDGALSLIDTMCRVHIEVKPDQPVEPIIKVLREYLSSGMYTTRDFLFASRSQATLEALHRELPEVELVVIEIWSSVKAISRARKIGAKRISLLENWLWPGFIRAVTAQGYQLCCYPPTNELKKKRFARLGLRGCTEDPAKARKWAAAGLYGIFTDRPDLFAK